MRELLPTWSWSLIPNIASWFSSRTLLSLTLLMSGFLVILMAYYMVTVARATPSESAIRRIPQKVDPEALDRAVRTG